MKLLLFAIFFFSPFLQANASTPKAATCTRKEYREEYIPGTQSSPGYVKNYVVDVEIPCGGERAQNADDNDLLNVIYDKFEMFLILQQY